MFSNYADKIPFEKIKRTTILLYTPILLIGLPLAIAFIVLRIEGNMSSSAGASEIGLDTGAETAGDGPVFSQPLPAYTPDKEILERIERLIKQDIEVDSRFDEDRNNPFR